MDFGVRLEPGPETGRSAPELRGWAPGARQAGSQAADQPPGHKTVLLFTCAWTSRNCRLSPEAHGLMVGRSDWAHWPLQHDTSFAQRTAGHARNRKAPVCLVDELAVCDRQPCWNPPLSISFSLMIHLSSRCREGPPSPGDRCTRRQLYRTAQDPKRASRVR